MRASSLSLRLFRLESNGDISIPSKTTVSSSLRCPPPSPTPTHCLQNPDDLPEDDTTVQVGPREQATAELAEHEAAEQSHGAMHLGSFRLGFYEWVEFLVRCAWVSNNGRRDGVAWAFDRMLWTTVPDDVAIAMLPRECYGRAPGPATAALMRGCAHAASCAPLHARLL